MFSAAIAHAETLVSEPRLIGQRWVVKGPGFSLWTNGLDIEAPVAFSLDEHRATKTRKRLEDAAADRLEWVAIVALQVKFSETRDPLYAYAADEIRTRWPSWFSDESRSDLRFCLLEALAKAVERLTLTHALSRIESEDSVAA
ncbi:hypothetical protein [Silanimonas sp.]|jgi:hypothetical protein|uniref:hypothetical protein n=1 Tax=Silanimonas sp. TaxID=1929290 RepID=UPI0022C9E194|nr:hypothetical protein [Silanimonas sp.]MCZ8063993.1 hypothetical protein [Silanimonas sp.]